MNHESCVHIFLKLQKTPAIIFFSHSFTFTNLNTRKILLKSYIREKKNTHTDTNHTDTHTHTHTHTHSAKHN